MSKVEIGNHIGLMELSAETRDKLYIARILPDGRVWYFVNLVAVDVLPNTPLCNDIRAVLDRVYDDVRALYRLPCNTEEYNDQYWLIRGKLLGA